MAKPAQLDLVGAQLAERVRAEWSWMSRIEAFVPFLVGE
jgi:hypothetical protein